jgi:tetratricopeptide (TPR) repeat protein
LLAADNPEINEIIDFISDITPPFAVKEYLNKKIGVLTGIIEKQKPDTTAEKTLRTLLRILVRPFRFKYSVGGLVQEMLKYDRNPVRKACYALGNYHFVNNDFEEAVKFYRIGISLGSISPLWDYLGATIDFVIWENILQGADWKSQPDILESGPWWKELDEKSDITEESIVKLFTPERLLKLNLERWLSEGESNAPAYYLAYNTACAYCRLGQQDPALGWLKVALRLNPALKKIAATDKDLALLRSKYKTEVQKLFSTD